MSRVLVFLNLRKTMIAEFHKIVLTDNEERLQLAGLANTAILALERKKKLTLGEKNRLDFARKLWEVCCEMQIRTPHCGACEGSGEIGTVGFRHICIKCNGTGKAEQR